jgi:hypothetical protein
MRFDFHLRKGIRQKLSALAEEMKSWEAVPRLTTDDEERLAKRIQVFEHTLQREGLSVAGVDGSGDYPSLGYSDSFVYVAMAQATTWDSDPRCGLRERGPSPEPVLEFVWVPEDETRRPAVFLEGLAALAGRSVDDVIAASDYALLKGREARVPTDPVSLRSGLIVPHAADAGNISIQLRSCAELGAALRALSTEHPPAYVLVDGTFSLPLLTNRTNSLFHEHLKRLCCVEANAAGVCFAALSKSHGLPSMENLEALASSVTGTRPAEHWFLRLPVPETDDWSFPLTADRRIPPPGTVTYLVRFHRTTPVLRLDVDRGWWLRNVHDAPGPEGAATERRLFEDLDYCCHDQRAYGYPYPLKAAHDRASLTAPEREALRKQIIDAAVQAGMKRSLFRSASRATGHEK